jgi:hypothetical protein
LLCHGFQAKISGCSHGHCLCKVGAFDASDATPAGEKARKLQGMFLNCVESWQLMSALKEIVQPAVIDSAVFEMASAVL